MNVGELGKEEKFAILILAAGNSSRYGSPKQLLPLGKSTLLNHIIDQLECANEMEVFVVLGAHFDVIAANIKHQQVHICNNTLWQNGIGTSISFGMKSILQQMPDIGNIIILLGDQPYFSNEILEEILKKYQQTQADIIFSSYQEGCGPPILFGKNTFLQLQQLTGDQGAKSLINSSVYTKESIIFSLGNIDIDTNEDYNRYLMK